MYYIISPINIKEIIKYEMPIKDKYGNRDNELFYKSREGLEFLNIAPMRIREVRDRKDCFEDIVNDLSWVMLCYNCPLFVYIIKDSWKYKNIKLSFSMYTNFDRASKMQKLGFDNIEYRKYLIEFRDRYYQGNISVMEQDIKEKLQEVNLVKIPLWEYRITCKEGFKNIMTI